MSDLYYPEYRAGTIELIYGDRKITHNINYYYSTRGLIIPIFNQDSIKYDILLDDPDSIVCKYSENDSETLAKNIDNDNIIKYVNYNEDPIIIKNKDIITYYPKHIAAINNNSLKHIEDSKLIINCSNYNDCGKMIYKIYKEPIYYYISINNYTNFTLIDRNKYEYDKYDGLVIENIRYNNGLQHTLSVTIKLHLNGEFEILSFHSDIYGSVYNINPRKNKDTINVIILTLIVFLFGTGVTIILVRLMMGRSVW
jgi:hypothetical protein